MRSARGCANPRLRLDDNVRGLPYRFGHALSLYRTKPAEFTIQRKDLRSAGDIGGGNDISEIAWRNAGFAFCVLMLGVHVAAALNSAGVPDSWRDMYWATSIAHGERFSLAGPQIYQLIELGPWWFYLLALPMFATGSVALTMVFV